MASRKFFYHLKETRQPDGKRWHLYVYADRQFSLRELLAKQHQLLIKLPEILFDEENFQVQLASCRESSEIRFIIPTTSAFHFDIIKNASRQLILDYDNILEITSTEKRQLLKILSWMKNNWKGEWKQEVECDRSGEN